MNYFKLSATPKQMAHLASILIADGCTVGEAPVLVPVQEPPHLYPPPPYPDTPVGGPSIAPDVPLTGEPNQAASGLPAEPLAGEPTPDAIPAVKFDPVSASHYSRRAVVPADPAAVAAAVHPALSYSGDGVEATGVYDAAREILGVTVSKKPWFLSLAHIKDALQERLGPA